MLAQQQYQEVINELLLRRCNPIQGQTNIFFLQLPIFMPLDISKSRRVSLVYFLLINILYMQSLTSRSNQSLNHTTLSMEETPSIEYKMYLKAEDLLCPKCLVRKRNHYCIEAQCPRKRLLCVPCDSQDSSGEHYTHSVAYVLPLLTNNVSRNIQEVFEGLNSFKDLVEAEIVKIQNYIQNLRGISGLITQMLDKLNLQKQQRKLQVFQEAISKVLKDKSSKSLKLDDVFKNINFITNQECKVKADAFKKHLLSQVSRLNWLPDPQKLLKDALLQKDQSSLPRSQYVFSVTKPIEISEIDTQFRQYYELLTDKLKYNPIIIRLQNQYSNKTKLYDVLMYHFRRCRKLTIFNASLNQIKTPLSFKFLKELDFICNPDCDSYTLRLQGLSEVTSLKLKRLKQEDAKFLKSIRSNLPKLKQLHLQFVNKYDMAINKDLIQFFSGDDENLRRLVLKLRTQSEVKRVYGHFTKFLKEVGQVTPTHLSLQQVILGYLARHKNTMTKLCLQGVKIVNHERFISILKGMHLLFEFRITELNNPMLNQIARRRQVTRRTMTILQRVYKRGVQHRCNQELLNNIINRMVWN